jgi:hypothetical protein
MIVEVGAYQIDSPIHRSLIPSLTGYVETGHWNELAKFFQMFAERNVCLSGGNSER